MTVGHNKSCPRKQMILNLHIFNPLLRIITTFIMDAYFLCREWQFSISGHNVHTCSNRKSVTIVTKEITQVFVGSLLLERVCSKSPVSYLEWCHMKGRQGKYWWQTLWWCIRQLTAPVPSAKQSVLQVGEIPMDILQLKWCTYYDIVQIYTFIAI